MDWTVLLATTVLGAVALSVVSMAGIGVVGPVMAYAGRHNTVQHADRLQKSGAWRVALARLAAISTVLAIAGVTLMSLLVR